MSSNITSKTSSNLGNNQLLATDNATATKDVILKYFAYFPLFILSILLGLSGAYIYLRYQAPQYKSKTSLYVKSDDKNSGSSRGVFGGNDLIDLAMVGGGKKVNLENEIELIKSKGLMCRVVDSNNLNTSYYTVGKVIRIESFYADLPFTFSVEKIKDSSIFRKVVVEKFNATGGVVEIYEKLPGVVLANKKPNKQNFTWGQPIGTDNFVFTLNKRTEKVAEQKYEIEWMPTERVAQQILGSLTIAPLSKQTTIIDFTLVASNPKRGAQVLDALIKQYINLNFEEKNYVAQSTVSFINNRLNLITKELGAVEQDLLNQEQANPVLSQSPVTTAKSAEYAENIKVVNDLGVKVYKANELVNYLRDNASKEKTIPSFLGIDDPVLAGLISEYNKAQLQLVVDGAGYAQNSELLARLKATVAELRASVYKRSVAYKDEVAASYARMKGKEGAFKEIFSQIPVGKHVMKAIGREASVKEAIFVYLMQKKEETLVSSAATTSSYKQIDKASVATAPFAPKPVTVLILGLLIGIIVPILYIFIRYFLNDRIIAREDITKIVKSPVVGEIGNNTDTKAFVVSNKSRSVISEQFRLLRNNIGFVLGDRKVLLVTSSISGEGKSFISLNLAAVLAITGKKVAVLEFDLRKPRIIANIGLEKRNIGISSYLAGVNNNLSEMFYTDPNFPSMHIYGCGPIPPNPAELMLKDTMTKLFTELKENYDYIIVDSAPVGLVGDSFTIANHVDATIYVIRQRYTKKNQMPFIQEVYETGKLKNMTIAINDVKTGAKYGYYSSGYGYGYGYSYGYSDKAYGGYFDDADKSTKDSFFKRIFG